MTMMMTTTTVTIAIIYMQYKEEMLDDQIDMENFRAAEHKAEVRILLLLVWTIDVYKYLITYFQSSPA